MTAEPLLAAHDWAAVHLVRPAMWGVRSVRRRTRRDAGLYREAMAFRHASREWTEERRREWILDRLRAVVREAHASTRFYREALDAIGFDPRAPFGFDDFRRLPVLERATVQERRADLLSDRVPAPERQWNATGGSSGRPVEIEMGPRERAWRASGADFWMQRLGVGPGVRRALLWGHHLDPVTRSGLGDRLADVAANRAWFDCLRLSPERLLEYHRAMTAYRPRCLVAYASALGTLAQVVEDAGLAPASYPTRRIVTGGEKLLREQRACAERVFAVPVHERYGSRDVGDMGFQDDAPRSLAYSIDWALVLLEPAGEDPESDILVTKLHGDAMPMIRYRTDDVGRFDAAARPGHPAFVLHEVLGRRADRVFKRDGGWLHGIHFPHLMKEFHLADFQAVQQADLSLHVSIVPGPRTPAGATDSLRDNLSRNLDGLPVTVAIVDRIERTRANKWRPVISHAGPR